MVDDERRRAYITELIAGIKKHGWMVQGVFPTEDSDGPAFAYTVGLAPKGKPELIVFGLPHQTAQVILNDLAARDGLAHGQELYDVLANNYRVRLVKVDDTTEHLTVSNTLYGIDGPVRALQVVIPDKDNRLPWEPGYSMPGQPVLGTP